MSDLASQLDGLVTELGGSRVRKLLKSFNKTLAQGKDTDDPLLQSLLADYGSDEVTEALAKLDKNLEETMGTVRRETPKVGRNDPCSCGSGKKFKKCCGR